MLCTKCGAENENDAQFCFKCGNILNMSQQNDASTNGEEKNTTEELKIAEETEKLLYSEEENKENTMGENDSDLVEEIETNQMKETNQTEITKTKAEDSENVEEKEEEKKETESQESAEIENSEKEEEKKETESQEPVEIENPEKEEEKKEPESQEPAEIENPEKEEEKKEPESQESAEIENPEKEKEKKEEENSKVETCELEEVEGEENSIDLVENIGKQSKLDHIQENLDLNNKEEKKIEYVDLIDVNEENSLKIEKDKKKKDRKKEKTDDTKKPKEPSINLGKIATSPVFKNAKKSDFSPIKLIFGTIIVICTLFAFLSLCMNFVEMKCNINTFGQNVEKIESKRANQIIKKNEHIDQFFQDDEEKDDIDLGENTLAEYANNLFKAANDTNGSKLDNVNQSLKYFRFVVIAFYIGIFIFGLIDFVLLSFVRKRGAYITTLIFAIINLIFGGISIYIWSIDILNKTKLLCQSVIDSSSLLSGGNIKIVLACNPDNGFIISYAMELIIVISATIILCCDRKKANI